MPSLTESRIQGAKPREKAFKLFDSLGLFLRVNPNGSRLWRLRYRFDGVEKLHALGAHPQFTLKQARELRDDARRLLARGIDPAMERKAAKLTKANTFQDIAKEWLEMQRKRFAEATFEKAEWTFNDLINPYIGSRPIMEISAPELLTVFRRLETRGKHETAHRTKQRCGQVFRYAIATGRAERDPTADLRGALAPLVVKHRAAIVDPVQIGGLLRAIYSYRGQPATEAALKLAAMMFVRPGELRKAEWAEFNLDGSDWRIPATRMKMRSLHIVPLATQAVDVLTQLHEFTGRSRYVFPSLRSRERPMSEVAITAALRRMGYSGEEMTWHGFRTIASTCLNEQGWHPDLIELQLAHAERNEVRCAYNRAQRLAERRAMMQAWADYLDGLRIGNNVVPLRRAG
jgi:integrase